MNKVLQSYGNSINTGRRLLLNNNGKARVYTAKEWRHGAS